MASPPFSNDIIDFETVLKMYIRLKNVKKVVKNFMEAGITILKCSKSSRCSCVYPKMQIIEQETNRTLLDLNLSSWILFIAKPIDNIQTKI